MLSSRSGLVFVFMSVCVHVCICMCVCICRNCIGTGMAMMEAMLVLACVVQQYELTPVTPGTHTLPTPKPLLTLRPDAVNLRLRPRHKN